MSTKVPQSIKNDPTKRWYKCECGNEFLCKFMDTDKCSCCNSEFHNKMHEKLSHVREADRLNNIKFKEKYLTRKKLNGKELELTIATSGNRKGMARKK